MVTKLACRNLFHDRLSLFVTLVGIVPSLLVINLSGESTPRIAMTFNLALVLLALTVAMCVLAGGQRHLQGDTHRSGGGVQPVGKSRSMSRGPFWKPPTSSRCSAAGRPR